MKIEWHPNAQKDAHEIAEFVSIESPRSALSLVDEFHRQVAMLSNHPLMGRPGRIAGTREFVIARTPYIAPIRSTVKQSQFYESSTALAIGRASYESSAPPMHRNEDSNFLVAPPPASGRQIAMLREAVVREG